MGHFKIFEDKKIGASKVELKSRDRFKNEKRTENEYDQFSLNYLGVFQDKMNMI